MAKRFDIAVSTVIKLMQRAKVKGSLVPKRMGGYRKYKLAAYDELVRQLVKATPDGTLDELVEDLGQRGIETSRSGLGRYLGHIGWSFKKTLRAFEQGRPDAKVDSDIAVRQPHRFSSSDHL